MQNHPNSFAALFEKAGDHLETRLDLLKLQAINKSSEVTSSILSVVALLVIGIFAITILNIGLGLWIGELLGKTYLGFFVLGGFYTVVAILVHLFRHTWLKQPVTSMFIKKMLN